MGLTGWLVRRAAGHPRPLVVAAEHGTRIRLLVEAELTKRRWMPAGAPGEANLLIVCGTPGPELDEAIRVVWDDMSSPRARADLTDTTQVRQALDRASAELADMEIQWREAAARMAMPWTPSETHGSGRGDGHEHHMGNPGGLPMAERGPDRDGLSLDRLHVPLGPILPDWPSGLVIETILQGDVIQDATIRWLGSGDPFWEEPWHDAQATRADAERRRAAAHLDSLGRLLAVAGWPAAATQARRLRDRLLVDAPRNELAPPYARFERRVRRTRRMMPEAGEALHRWLSGAGQAIDTLEDDGPLDSELPARGVLDPELLVGAELATARLIVASIDPAPAVAHA